MNKPVPDLRLDGGATYEFFHSVCAVAGWSADEDRDFQRCAQQPSGARGGADRYQKAVRHHARLSWRYRRLQRRAGSVRRARARNMRLRYSGQSRRGVCRRPRHLRLSSIAEAGVKYSRAHLSAEHKQYLRDLPLFKTTERWTYVHASLAEPSGWYYVSSPREALLHFCEQRTPVAFCGHTHRPLVWFRDRSGKLGIEQPRALVALYRPAKYLVNVGSVGQSRDGDPRACYTIFDTDNNAIQFRRVSYNVRATQKKILAAGLPEMLALRLELGL